MGNRCLSPSHTTDLPPSKKKSIRMPPDYKDPVKNRVNDTDKAILDVKTRMRKLKTYLDKINL